MTNPPRGFDGDPDDRDDSDLDYDEEYERRSPNPVRPDPPLFAPVVFDDEEEPRRRAFPTGDYDSDRGLLRVLGIIAVLGIVIIALVLPWSPIAVIGGGGDEGDIPATARGDVPPLPEGLVALSQVYDITVPDTLDVPLSVSVELTERVQDASDLALYSWDGQRWTRLSSVQLQGNGERATGTIPPQSSSIAVLRRVSLAHGLALIVDAGEKPDSAGLEGATVVAVMAGTLPADGDDGDPTVEFDEAAAGPTLEVAGGRKVYLGISGAPGSAGILASRATIASHVAEVAEEATRQGVGGVYLDYSGVSPEERQAYVDLLTALDEAVTDASMELVVGVPMPGTPDDTGGYEWVALQAVADTLWVRAPLVPQDYYASVGSILEGDNDVVASRVWLVLDRRSVLTRGDRPAEPIALIEALTAASAIDYSVDAIGPGSPVSLRSAVFGEDAGGSLQWNDDARAVVLSYAAEDEDITIALQNRFSIGFALDAAANAGLGGVVIASAGEGGGHPDIWEPVTEFVQEGRVSLLLPYGPYLTPCWQAEDGVIEGQPECWTTSTDTSAVVWRAPEDEGAYTVRLIVSEGTTFVAQEVILRVGEDAPPEEEPTEEPEATEEPEPDETATPEPTEEPAAEPTQDPTQEPTSTPNAEATGAPAGPAGNESG